MKIMPVTIIAHGNCLINSAALLLKNPFFFLRLYQFSVCFLMTLSTVIVKEIPPVASFGNCYLDLILEFSLICNLIYFFFGAICLRHI